MALGRICGAVWSSPARTVAANKRFRAAQVTSGLTCLPTPSEDELHLMTESQAFLKVSKEKKLQGKINVTVHKVIFTPSQGEGFSVTGSQLKGKPQGNSATAENVALKISSKEKDYVLYFQGPDAAKRRDAIKEAIIQVLVSSQGAQALTAKSEGNSKSPPLTPPRPSEGDGGKSEEKLKGEPMSNLRLSPSIDDVQTVSQEVQKQRELKLFQDSKNRGPLRSLLSELVKTTKFLTEDEFWTHYGDAKDAVAEEPVPSTIPTMKDVVRTNSTLKIKLDAANIHKLFLDYPGLKEKEMEAVQAQKVKDRLEFFSAFYNYKENGPSNVDPPIRELLKPVIEGAASSSHHGVPSAVAKRRLLQVHSSVDLTAVGGAGALYGGSDGIGMATGPVSKKRRRLAREGGKEDGSMVIDKVNRHQFSVLETLVPWSEDKGKDGKVGGGDGGEGESGYVAFGNKEGLGKRERRGGGLDCEPPQPYQRLPLKAPWDLAGGSHNSMQNGFKSSCSKTECAEEWRRWHLADGRQRIGSEAGHQTTGQLEAELGTIQQKDKSEQSEKEQNDLKERLGIINGLLHHHWATSLSKSSDKERLKRLQDRLDQLAAGFSSTLTKLSKESPNYQLVQHAMDIIGSIKRVA